MPGPFRGIEEEKAAGRFYSQGVLDGLSGRPPRGGGYLDQFGAYYSGYESTKRLRPIEPPRLLQQPPRLLQQPPRLLPRNPRTGY